MKKLFSGSFRTLFTVLFVGSVFASAVTPAFASGYLTLSAFSGHPGVTVQASGGGLATGDVVNVYLGSTSNKVGTATAAADSSFGPVAVSIPANTAQGPISIIAIDSNTNQQLTNSYYVNPFTPTLTVATGANTPGTSLTVAGSGFASNEMVTLALAGATGTATADATGAFTAGHITIPNVTAQTYTLTGTGQASNAQAIAYFYVGAFFASVSPSTYYVLPTQPLSFSGSGFAAGETVNVTSGTSTTPLSTLTTAADGTFTAAGAVNVPVNFAGTTQTFTLTGTTSHASASTTVTVGNFFPGVYPSAYYLAPNASLSFSGSGFAGNETVNVYEGINTSTVYSTFTTSATGAFTNAGSFMVPYNFAGSTRTFRLIGSLSHAEGDVNVTIGQYYPTISPSTYYINPGQTMTVSGSGFAPSEKVDISVGGSTPVQVTNGVLGTFNNVSITVPYSALPFATLTAFGESSHATATTTITLGAYFATVTPSSYYVQPGSMISFLGTGFAPSENVQISVASSPTATPTTIESVTTDAAGNLSAANISVPLTASGSQIFSFSGSLSNVHTSVTVGVAPLNPNVSADNYFALPGSIVHVTGTGFGISEPVHVTAGTFSANTTATVKGAVGPIAVTLPFGNTTSSIVITLTGGSSHVSASTTVTLASFYPSVSPSTYYTTPGSSVSFTGSGFAANEKVNETLNGASIGSTTADAMGNIIVAAATMPLSVHNAANYTFTGASSGASASVSVTLSGFYASVGLSNYYAVGGTAETVSGIGFAGNEPVSVTFGGVSLGNATTAADGSFSMVTTVPFATAGNKNVVATGTISGASATTTFTEAPVYVSAQLGTYAGAPGTAVDFIGSGYLPNEPVTIMTSQTGSTVEYTFNADASGNFNNSGFMIPANFTPGNLTITITGQHSLTPVSIVYYVTGA